MQNILEALHSKGYLPGEKRGLEALEAFFGVKGLLATAGSGVGNLVYRKDNVFFNDLLAAEKNGALSCNCQTRPKLTGREIACVASRLYLTDNYLVKPRLASRTSSSLLYW